MPQIHLAVAENAFQELFNRVRDQFTWSVADENSFGPFIANYALGIHLEGGTIDLIDNPGPDRVVISELDVVVDELLLQIGFDIPEFCTPPICLFWIPFIGCVGIPSFCLFEDTPDFGIDLDLGGLIEIEFSGAFGVTTTYFNDPANAGMIAHEAYENDVPNRWQFFLQNIQWTDTDFDIADTVGNIIEQAILSAITTALPAIPGIVMDVIEFLVGGLIQLITAILDLPDDLQEWLADLLQTNLLILNQIVTAVANYLAAQNPIFEFPDPYPIATNGSLVPVLLPIQQVQTDITNIEFVIAADIGA